MPVARFFGISGNPGFDGDSGGMVSILNFEGYAAARTPLKCTGKPHPPCPLSRREGETEGLFDFEG